MKKIGLFTINDYNNYGNRLQNYAAQEYLRSLGFDVETVKNLTSYSKYARKPNFHSRIKNLMFMPPDKAYEKIRERLIKKANKNGFHSLTQNRRDNFNSFTNNYILETDYSITDIDIPKKLKVEYDFYVTGSDQVWNPFNPRTSEIDFLTHAPQVKRIAFSPSFGVSRIPNDHLDRYMKWISEMEFLSVREDEGARIIKELTGRDVPVLIDPTLLLNKTDWLRVTKPAKNITGKAFLLTYFLGGTPKKFKKRIIDLAAQNGLEIINLGDIFDKETYIAGPSEFLDYIANCSVFCTDSFHGAVFSIIFEKPFLIYQREGSISMYSRINTLLDKFNLTNRKSENILTNDEVFEIDYSNIQQLLKREKRKVFEYLSKALDIEDDILK